FDGREYESAGTAWVRVVAMRPFHDTPTIVEPGRVHGLDVHLLPSVLADIRDVEQPAGRVERIAPRVAQAQRPDLRSPTSVLERIARGNRIRVTAVYIDPQQLAEQRIGVLGPVLGISSRAAVAHADVEHAVGTEHNEPALVVRAGRNGPGLGDLHNP